MGGRRWPLLAQLHTADQVDLTGSARADSAVCPSNREERNEGLPCPEGPLAGLDSVFFAAFASARSVRVSGSSTLKPSHTAHRGAVAAYILLIYKKQYRMFPTRANCSRHLPSAEL